MEEAETAGSLVVWLWMRKRERRRKQGPEALMAERSGAVAEPERMLAWEREKSMPSKEA